MSPFAALLVLAGGRQTLVDQISKALPPPTGRNGYEEYCQAANEFWSHSLSLYELAYPFHVDPPSPGEPPPDPATGALIDHLQNMSFLDIKREEVEKAARVLQLVRAGNLKPVYDPRPKLTPETTFPELSQFKGITRDFAAECYVRFADGDSAGGVRSLMDGLAFSYHISGGSLIAALVGVAGSAILFRSFDGRLPQLSIHDCQDIETVSAQLLAAPMGLKAGLEVERKSNVETVGNAFRSGSNLKEFEQLIPIVSDMDKGGGSTAKQLDAMIRGAQPTDFNKWANESADAVNTMYAGLEAKLALPEAKWFGSDDDMALLKNQHSPIVAALVDALAPAWDNVFAAIAKQRTQFRLLELHGKVLEYKWQNNKLPGRLSDAVESAGCQDPLSGREFGYTRKGDGYRLFSYGAKPTGEIELVYRNPGAAQAASGPP